MSESEPRRDQYFTAPQRFGCGAILAGIVALVIVVQFIHPGWLAFAIIAALAITGGWFAVRGGDQAPFRMLGYFFRMVATILTPWA